jgi:hypothetical protein
MAVKDDSFTADDEIPYLVLVQECDEGLRVG